MQFRQSILATVLLIVLFLGCSTRHVYDTEVTTVSQSMDAININTATLEQLDRLPYIGRKTAEKIVQFREENGPFRRVEHLMQIRGISEKRFLELQPFLKAE